MYVLRPALSIWFVTDAITLSCAENESDPADLALFGRRAVHKIRDVPDLCEDPWTPAFSHHPGRGALHGKTSCFVLSSMRSEESVGVSCHQSPTRLPSVHIGNRRLHEWLRRAVVDPLRGVVDQSFGKVPVNKGVIHSEINTEDFSHENVGSVQLYPAQLFGVPEV